MTNGTEQGNVMGMRTQLPDRRVGRNTAVHPDSWRRKLPLGLAALAALSNSMAWAAEVYKCRDGGKINYTSDPSPSARCEQVDLKVVEPNPADVARALEEKRRRALDEQAEEERARQERLVRAKEMEAQAALRSARAAEEEARLARLRQQEAANQPSYPLWGYPSLQPHPHLHRHPQRRADSHFDRKDAGWRRPPPVGLRQPVPKTELRFSIGHRDRGAK
jgi:hypothetical protein